MVLCAGFPSRSFGDRRPLYDRLFNLEPFVTQDGDWSADPAANRPKDPFTHPAFGNGASKPDNRTLQRLIAGLQVTDQELVELLVDLGLAAANGGPVPLTPTNLALLYRHARLARWLNLSVEQLLQLLALGEISAKPHAVRTLADLASLLAFYDRWQASGFSLDDLGFVTDGKVLKGDGYPAAAVLADAIARAVRADRPLEFAETVLTQLPGVTEASSRAFVAANEGAAGALEKVADAPRWRLKATFDVDSGALNLPAGLGATAAQVRSLLKQYDPREILPGRIAAQFRRSETNVGALMKLSGDPLAKHDAALRQELEPERGTAAAPKIEAILRRLMPLTVLLRSDAWDDDALDFLSKHPGIFGLIPAATPDAVELPVSVEAAFKVAAYVRLTTTAEPDFTPEKPQPDPAAVREVLELLEKDPAVDPAAAVVARALRVPPSRIETLYPHLDLAVDPFAALGRLAACLALAGYLGVSGETLKLLVPTAQGVVPLDATQEYDALVDAAEGMYGVIRAKYPEGKLFEEKMEGLEDRIRGLKRDGLVEYLTRSTNHGFAGPDDLYQMYLVDTQVGGCARTSRLVAAISSLQLYVHRVLMSLEQEDPELGGANPVHVPPSRIVEREWAWRKNYRVWEANRKVFLHPESFLEPSLRDDKTPLFDELESALQQQEISEQSVTDAYASYLRGFVEVAGLKIAGAYNERAAWEETLHLLGVTPTDPPTFYYRRIETSYLLSQGTELNRPRMVATPWRKLDVQIPTRTASPMPFLGTFYIFWGETNSRPRSTFSNGNTIAMGFDHTVSIKYSRLLVDGRWTAPQLVGYPGSSSSTFEFNNQDSILSGYMWERVYPGVRLGVGKGEPSQPMSTEFTQRSTFYLSGMGISHFQPFHVNEPAFRDFYLADFTAGGTSTTYSIIRRGLNANGTSLFEVEQSVPTYRTEFFQSAYLLEVNINSAIQELLEWRYVTHTQPVNGATMDYIINIGPDNFLFSAVPQVGRFQLERLGTTVAGRFVECLSSGGLDELLSTSFQEGLGEVDPPFKVVSSDVIDSTYDVEKVTKLPDGSIIKRPIDFTGLTGVYFREIFFQIPFLIADHLNSQQRFSAAQRWYHYIFNPTSPEAGADRVWRYREFRGLKTLSPKAVREYLTNPQALAAYREDPFNPHAIARLRLSAYQKAVVMKYIDNLLDWGDSLFAEFTMESVNEATMLYVMAADILGPRPADVGECGEGDSTPITYGRIAPRLTEDSQFLIELEHLAPNKAGSDMLSKMDATWIKLAQGGHANIHRFVSDGSVSPTTDIPVTTPGDAGRSITAVADAGPSAADGWRETRQSYWTQTGGTELRNLGSYGAIEMNAAPPVPNVNRGALFDDHITIKPEPGSGTGGHPGLPPGTIMPEDYRPPGVHGLARGNPWEVQPLEPPMDDSSFQKPPKIPQLEPLEIVKTSLVFCFPPNRDLLAYWDRVESRLYRIRNCMDISGGRRQPALFAPEIDPRLLVRARAAGLSLEEVLGVTSGSVPPYRFAFLIEKARQYAGTVQSLGAALLSALEKRDAEELSRLRVIHEQNLLKFREQSLTWEIEVADDTLESLKRQKKAIEDRQKYYEALIDGRLIPAEVEQQTKLQDSTEKTGIASQFNALASIAALIPQMGAPTAMTFGGRELSGSIQGYAAQIRDIASTFQSEGASAGLEADCERRRQEWEQQKLNADNELSSIEKQIDAATVRVDIAKDSLAVHDKTVKQAEELFEFYRDKFSSFGLYTWLSTQAHRLYRDAFNMAFAVAKMAEQAYRFERDDDQATFLSATHWDTTHSGLLAGERLLLDLQQLERRFLETNVRALEVEQSFSLMQFAPDQLLKLRQTGECEFTIPEILFDLVYPGHYRRRIKAVRLTIPSVTGPFVNVAATLRLKSSWLRREPVVGQTGLSSIPSRHAMVIATSSAQNDAGVFEFGFRDERYMPFEGAGAVESAWQLTLPKNFRPFDYQTISDVVLRISYTAEENEALRADVEAFSSEVEGTVRHFLDNTGLPFFISIRHQFPDVWHRLAHSPVGTPVNFELTKRHLPFLFASMARRSANLAASDVQVMLQSALAPEMELVFDGTLLSAAPPATPSSSQHWSDKTTGLHSATVPNATVIGQHAVMVQSSGNLGGTQGNPPGAIDTAELTDILLRMTLKTTVSTA